MATTVKVIEKGKGNVDLRPSDFLAQGGEKAIYVRGRTAYCIYLDRSKMIPEGKFKELAVLDHPHIMQPKRLLTDRKGKPIGFTTAFLKDAYTACQMFTKAFKKRHGITGDTILELMSQFREMIAHIHSHNVLVVDLNEYNFLIDKKFQHMWGIDVNSYQTPHYPTTAIMESIRDRHANYVWTPESDWYSWGIVSFQMLIGIHPYKGKHPDFNGPVLETMENRMKNNVSVFNPKATMPKVCEPLDIIPPALRDWYKAIFEDGQRVLPPLDFAKSMPVQIAVKKVVGSDNFVIDQLQEYEGNILGVYISGAQRIVVTDQFIYVGNRKTHLPSLDVRVGFTPKLDRPIAAWVDDDELKLFDILAGQPMPISSHANAVTTEGRRLLIKNGGSMLEVAFNEYGQKAIASLREVGRVLPQAAKVFDGVVLQEMLGRWVASVFDSGTQQFDLPELDDYRIMEAKYENKVLVVVGHKAGQYDRIVFRLSTDYQKYDVRVVENITPLGLNFAVADHGVCVLVNEDEGLEAFQNNRHAPQVKLFDPDPAIDAGTKLYHDGSTILLAKDDTLYSVRMKK